MGMHFLKNVISFGRNWVWPVQDWGPIKRVKQNVQCQTNHQLITTVVPSTRGTYQAQFITEHSIFVRCEISVFENNVHNYTDKW